MQTNETQYAVLYKINLALSVNEVININTSDIVSITMIHNYDTATYPIIRIRLYSNKSFLIQIILKFIYIWMRMYIK